MRAFYLLGLFTTFIIFLWSCSNIEDASPSKRASFIRLYEGPEGYSSSDIIETESGFILLGGMKITDDSILTVIIETDKFGNTTKSPAFFPGGAGKSVIPFTRSDFNGYLIIGDRIKVDPSQEIAGNIEISSLRLLCLDNNLEMKGSYTIEDQGDPTVSILTDFTGSSITLTDDNRVVILGTYKPGASSQRPMLVILNENFTMEIDPLDDYKQFDPLDINWIDFYNILDKDFVNGKSLHYSNGDIRWASSILDVTGSLSDTYVAVPTIQEPLTYTNFSLCGDNFPVEKQFTVKDMQKSKIDGVGYGMVGTFAQTDGQKKNMFFAQVDNTGTILTTDTLFIDGFAESITSNISFTDDTGEAITGTYDGGYVIAGTIETASIDGKTIGNGLRDILLVKVNATGDLVWKKIIGGAGDEVVTRIRETSDKGLVITGTNLIGQTYSSIFLIKTNEQGEIIK